MLEPEVLQGTLSQHLAIIGKTGAGKTYCAKGLTESLLDAGRRVCVIDPTGVWWGLRSSEDGKEPAYSVVVFGGEHGDVPITDKAGERLAELLCERSIPAIIDLSEFTNAGRHRFMTAFAATLYQLNRRPLHLIIDEADEFAPQNPLAEAKRMSGEIDRIVRRGRARGFRVTMITQRPAVLHKNVLTQVNTLVALRLTAPQDRDALKAWIDAHGDRDKGAEVLGSLAKLPVGTGWVWAPDADLLTRTQFRPIRTFDSSRTPDEDDDLQSAVLADVDLGGLADLLALNDETSKPKNGKSPKVTPDIQAIEEAYRRGRADGREEMQAEVLRILSLVDQAKTALAQAELGCRAQPRSAAAPRQAPAPAPVRRRPAAAAPGGLNSGATKLLTVLVQHAPAVLTWPQCATLAGLKARGGHFNAARKALADGGLIAETGAGVTASEAGIALVGNVAPAAATTAEDLRALWVGRLPSPANEMLDYLHGQGRRWIDRQAMAAALGKKPIGGHWNSGLATLRRNGLIEEAGGTLRAAEILFGVN